MSRTQSVFNKIIFSPLLIVKFVLNRKYLSKFYTYLVFLFLFIKEIEISIFKFVTFTCSTLKLDTQIFKYTLNQ